MGCLNAKGRVSKNKGVDSQVLKNTGLEINPATPSNYREASLSGDNATHLTGAGREGVTELQESEITGYTMAFS